MTINFQYIDLDTSAALTTYTEEKLQSLIKKYEWLINCDVQFKKENSTKEDGFICSMELSMPGPRIYAVSNEKNFEAAVKETIGDLEKQLKKRKHTFSIK
ncbi:ribosome hibernation-promoting factor, HPF/YfiA family [Bizionia myxarmorum]|uniref:Ribosome-associated translation inhibitor RaiA n=1 Tax=Bizionia myxarmorum TaxID=291186 RepID=A0A5D0R6E5_9FLAO|nr:ribosome-associated translation inhibitor RaiA [Bizionia myxarmorum]TYB77220.1 ribosome-associated translation inhibitor RaiA [Bizionia myxarmorum]